MPTKPGQMVSHYRLVEKIGEGGMGVVWKALDTALDREVAIKVLPDEVAADPGRLARFDREAHVLAALNHPHIASIYGLEKSGGVPCLVLELVEGQTLADRLATGAVPVERALELARQIASALEAAHEKGVIHRDLKPANVKITPEGTVKVLDFGLAKALAEDSTEESLDSSKSPTRTMTSTRAGVILGTAAYMSPEQARGKPVDKRADIWSFGCVLYELLTGRQAFPGETASDSIAAILGREPAWEAIPPGTPLKIRELLQRCLRKENRDRLHDVADARIEIDEVLADRSVPASAARVTGAARVPWLRPLPWAIVAVLAVLSSTVIWMQRTTAPPGVKDTIRFSLELPRGVQFDDQGLQLAVSPDGRRLAMAVDKGEITQIFLRELDQTEAVPLAGTEGGEKPFFSPDGKWIGLIVGTDLKKISVEGGRPVLVCDHVLFPNGGAWGSDDSIIFTRHYGGGLWRVAASGGEPEELTTPDASRGELGHWSPQILPGGREVLYTSYRSPIEKTRVMVHSLETGQQKTVIEGGYFGRYVPTGHIVYLRRGTLFAVRFDPDTLETTGSPLPVPHDIASDYPTASASFSFAANGTMAYIPRSVLTPPRNLVWVDRDGSEEPVTTEPRAFLDTRISPDGRRAAVSIAGKDSDLWIYELPRGAPSRLTHEPEYQTSPIWTADGRRVIYSRENVQFDIYWRPSDGSGEEELLYSTEHDLYPTDVSPDGKLLVFGEDHSVTDGDLWILPLDDDRQPTPVARTRFEELYGAFSPDGRWLAHQSNESGRYEVYVQAIAGPGGKVRVSVDGGETPSWSPDGKELYFRSGHRMMAATIDTGAELRVGKPFTLFEGRYSRYWASRAYDVAPDGRFLMVKTPEESAPRQLNVVLNWFEELKRLAPAGGS